jgi:hypothetical protein
MIIIVFKQKDFQHKVIANFVLIINTVSPKICLGLSDTQF